MSERIPHYTLQWQIMSDSDYSRVIYYCHLHPVTTQVFFPCISCRPISLHTAIVMNALLWAPRGSTYSQPLTSTTFIYVLPQLTTDVTTGLNQNKRLHRTICIALDLTATFDTVNHNVFLSELARSMIPEATYRWLSNYIGSRQYIASGRGI